MQKTTVPATNHSGQKGTRSAYVYRFATCLSAFIDSSITPPQLLSSRLPLRCVRRHDKIKCCYPFVLLVTLKHPHICIEYGCTAFLHDHFRIRAIQRSPEDELCQWN